jgi:hypothetical protein
VRQSQGGRSVPKRGTGPHHTRPRPREHPGLPPTDYQGIVVLRPREQSVDAILALVETLVRFWNLTHSPARFRSSTNVASGSAAEV